MMLEAQGERAPASEPDETATDTLKTHRQKPFIQQPILDKQHLHFFDCQAFQITRILESSIDSP